jgi:N-acetylmuramoyl-L-alanine amidase
MATAKKAAVTPPTPKPTKADAAAATTPGKTGETAQGCGDIVVVIDPGHGDTFYEKGDPKTVRDKPDSGAVHPQKPPHVAWEKDIALAVSKSIKTKLTGKPHVKSVILTRDADVTTPVARFSWRTDIAKANDARVFVSVHVNSTVGATGHIIFYYSPNAAAIQGESSKLATEISTAYKIVAKFKGGGTKGESKRMGLIKFGPGSPVKSATLVETGFIQEDHPTLNSKADAIGGEIAEGIAKYIKENISALCGT